VTSSPFLLYALMVSAGLAVMLAVVAWDAVVARCRAERRARQAEEALEVMERRWAIHEAGDRRLARALVETQRALRNREMGWEQDGRQEEVDV